MRSISLIIILVWKCFYHGGASEDIAEYLLFADNINNQFAIIGPTYEKEVALNFSHGKNIVKSMEAYFAGGLLRILWIYFGNKGLVHYGKVPLENPRIDIRILNISNQKADITDIDFQGEHLFASTSDGKIYDYNLEKDQMNTMLDDGKSIMSLKAHESKIFFSECFSESRLVSKSITRRIDYKTSHCFSSLDIDIEEDKFYAIAAINLYLLEPINKDLKQTIIHTSNYSIEHLSVGDEFIYFKTRGDKIYKSNKNGSSTVEIPELSAYNARGDMAVFMGPSFIRPVTGGPHIDSWMVKYKWLIYGILLLLLTIMIVVVIICIVCIFMRRKKKKENYEKL